MVIRIHHFVIEFSAIRTLKTNYKYTAYNLHGICPVSIISETKNTVKGYKKDRDSTQIANKYPTKLSSLVKFIFLRSLVRAIRTLS
jgi:hypothetical protein